MVQRMPLELVSTSDPEYQLCSDKIRATYPDACIVTVERNLNEPLRRAFDKRFEKIHLRRGVEPTIKELFHGTRDGAAVADICRNGFDCYRNVASSYGRGTYFATEAGISVPYMGSDDLELGYMLICDVLVGECCQGRCNEFIDTEMYDNAVNSLQRPTIYVTPYHKGAFPKFVVAFYTGAKRNHRRR